MILDCIEVHKGGEKTDQKYEGPPPKLLGGQFIYFSKLERDDGRHGHHWMMSKQVS